MDYIFSSKRHFIFERKNEEFSKIKYGFKNYNEVSFEVEIWLEYILVEQGIQNIV